VSPEERIRRLLQARLGQIGVSPDMRNDGPAVRAVAAQLKIDVEAVVNELVEMRTEQNLNMARRLGQPGLSAGALTMLAASRDSLLGEGDFDQAFRTRAHQGLLEVASSLRPRAARERAVTA
jgi:hypothetical protein